MARDYSSRAGSNKNNNSKKKPRARPAAKPKPQPRSNSKNSGPPGWVLLFSGLCIGLVIAAAAYMFARPAGSPGISIEIAGIPGSQKKAEEQPAPAEVKPEKPRFAFYEMLPNYEVVIPEEEYVEPESNSTQTAPKSQNTTPKIKDPGRYVIQAGSFTNYDDADRRKAGLALLGVESEIQEGENSAGRKVYRVRSTPVDDLDQINETLKRLKSEGIDTLVMRYKG